MITIEVVSSDDVKVLEVADTLIQYIIEAGSDIDDTASRSDAVYSSRQMERRLTETIGNPNIDLVLIFENQLSKEL